MHRSLAPLAVVASVAVLGAAQSCTSELDGAPAEGVRADAAPIVNGQADPGHPYAVAITTQQGQSFCSGTVVSPTVVVTAAHCIFPGIGFEVSEGIQVYFGSDVDDGGQFIPVADGKYFPTFDVDSPAADDDVAVLRLSEPAPVAPIRMGKAPTNGKTVTLVGFGITASMGGGGGVKRVTTAKVDLLAAKTFQMKLAPSGTCNGDSGGTAIFVEPDGEDAFVGIHTRSDCQNFMLDERVDKHIAGFIQPFIDEDATCAHDFGCASTKPAGCDEPDPDCPCADDGYCVLSETGGACETPDDDPDCVALCADDGECEASCGDLDPDCATCTGDGVCDAGCAADPDCGAGGSGATTTSGAPGIDEPRETNECACRAGDAPPAAPFAALYTALALGLVARRRSR